MQLHRPALSVLKFVKSLHQKKFRNETGLFFCEGSKICIELLTSDYPIHSIFITELWTRENAKFHNLMRSANCYVVSNAEMERISALTTPTDILIVSHQKASIDLTENSGLMLALDNISDPGNMGTIIRIADWFGIESIICSHDTVDFYNPKVIQSTMGAFLRVSIFYTDLKLFLKEYSKKYTVFATLLEGKNIYETTFPENCCILIGNESKGISDDIKTYAKERITIPSFAKKSDSSGCSESLNASVATAIVVSEARRKRK